MSNEIWVLIEKARSADNIAAISRELLGKGRQLADASGAKLGALVFGAGVAALAERAFAYGADKAYVVDDPALAQIVRSEQAQAWDMNISGVPAMIVQGKFLIPGAQEPEVYAQALRRVVAKGL